MRVALVCPYAWDAAGGVQVHVADLAAELRSRGHDVLVVAPNDGGVGGRAAGPVLRVPYRGTVAPIAPSPLATFRLRHGFDVWRPDVVHVHEPLTPSTSMWATLAARAPVVATFHSHLDRSRALELAAPVLRKVVARLHATIAVSEAAASFLRRAFPRARPIVIPNGVDVQRFASARAEELPHDLPSGTTIAWTHRLDPQKGFGVALRAFATILGSVPDARLVVAGDGRDRALVDGLEPGVRRRVALLGSVPHDRVAGVLRAADVAIAPATGQESFGIVLVEAMAAGVPVVASDIAGYREVVTDGVDGLTVPPGDADALASAVVRLLTDPALADALRREGRRRAAAFDWGEVATRLEAVYLEAREAGPLR